MPTTQSSSDVASASFYAMRAVGHSLMINGALPERAAQHARAAAWHTLCILTDEGDPEQHALAAKVHESAARHAVTGFTEASFAEASKAAWAYSRNTGSMPPAVFVGVS